MRNRQKQRVATDTWRSLSSLYLASLAAQAGLCFTWSQNPEDRFSRDEAHIILYMYILYMMQETLSNPIVIKGQIRPISNNGSLSLAMKQEHHIHVIKVSR